MVYAMQNTPHETPDEMKLFRRRLDEVHKLKDRLTWLEEKKRDYWRKPVTKQFRTMEAVFEAWDDDRRFDHEFIWYVSVPLTLEQWLVLDDAMGEAFEAAGISLDDVVGVAGPIPVEESDESE